MFQNPRNWDVFYLAGAARVDRRAGRGGVALAECVFYPPRIRLEGRGSLVERVRKSQGCIVQTPEKDKDQQCCEKILMRIPQKSGENPHKIPHSNEISPLWGKSGFYCIFINKSFGSGHRYDQIYEIWTSFTKINLILISMKSCSIQN